MIGRMLPLLMVVAAAGCAHAPGPVSRPPVDRERFPLNCDDGNPMTPDDTLIDGICIGLVDPDGDGIPNHGSGPPCTGPDEPPGCVDNCRFVTNPDQVDSNRDGLGEACSQVAEWYRVRSHEKVVALTFDDGYNDASLSAILGVLEQYRAKATFFLNGLYVANGSLKPETLKRLRAAGHLSGNHTQNHTLGNTPRETMGEIVECEEEMHKAAAIRLKPLFRSPAYAETVWRNASLLQSGYSVHLKASLDAKDWTVPPPPPHKLARCVIEEARPGDIVLFHVGPTSTPQALGQLLSGLTEQGYRFVTAEELLYFGEPAADSETRLCSDYY